jgi:hypothetical protein
MEAWVNLWPSEIRRQSSSSVIRRTVRVRVDLCSLASIDPVLLCLGSEVERPISDSLFQPALSMNHSRQRSHGRKTNQNGSSDLAVERNDSTAPNAEIESCIFGVDGTVWPNIMHSGCRR